MTGSPSYKVQNFEASFLIDAEEIKGPKSIAECVMRCQRKTKEGFYANNNKCFCHYGVLENQGDNNGISTEEIDFNLPNNGKEIRFLVSNSTVFLLTDSSPYEFLCGSGGQFFFPSL